MDLLDGAKKGRNKKEVTQISYRFEKELFEEFRKLCKLHKINQTKVFENAMRITIDEIKGTKRWKKII